MLLLDFDIEAILISGSELEIFSFPFSESVCAKLVAFLPLNI